MVRNPDFPATGIFACLAVMCLAFLVTGLYRRRDTSIRLTIMKWTMGAYALHLAIGLAIWFSPTLTAYFGGDALTYNSGAIALNQHWEGLGAMPLLPAGKDGFFYLLAAIYYVFGEHAGAGIAIDAGFAAAMIPLLHDATDRHFGEAAARYVPPLCVFMPGFLIWGSQLLREAGIYFAIAAGINAMVRLSKRITFPPMAVAAASIVMVFVWRASVGALMAGGLLVAMILQNRTQNTVATVVMASVVGLAVVGFGLGHDGLSVLTHTSLTDLNATRSASATEAASGFLPSSDISTGSHAIYYLPLGLPEFMFGPMPWQVSIGRQLFGIPDAFVWWALIPSLWRGFREATRRIGRGVTLYVAPALANAIGLCLIIANFGTAVRERMQVIVFLIPLVALGLSLRTSGRNRGASLAPGVLPGRMVGELDGR